MGYALRQAVLSGMQRPRPHAVAVIGLGYVGLPLAVAFSQELPTVGFDIDRGRIAELKRGFDRNGEVAAEALQGGNLTFTVDEVAMSSADFIIVAAPTPVDDARQPDLSALRSASRSAGNAIRARRDGPERAAGRPTTIVYESTVYPGCTEEVCVPILEQASGGRWRVDFNVGYSPERINPGDPRHTLSSVIKIVSGDCPETLDLVAQTYALVATAGVHRAPDIKTAEAAKVIENVQRDLNIALMNELAILFKRMDISTDAVLKAAGTKWNFMKFEPGLVGGHCIPVDPYYLTHRAQVLGHHADVILAGRRINDSMVNYVAEQTLLQMVKAGQTPGESRILVMGLTFKEDVADVRNSGALSLAKTISAHSPRTEVIDPHVSEAAIRKFGLKPATGGLESVQNFYDVVVLAVPHREYRALTVEQCVNMLRRADGQSPVVIDIKMALGGGRDFGDRALYWSLL